MKNKIIDLIDFEKVNLLLDGFNKTTGFVTAILDLDGHILSKSGWTNICVEFHRQHPETVRNCKISDVELAGRLAFGKKYHIYKCMNGLIDVAIPIVIKDEHIANLFTGQFFFEKPDLSFFIQQAQKYGFNQKDYLGALDKVPIVSETQVKTAMDFLLDMTELIVRITLQKFEQLELNNSLKESEKRLSFHNKYSPLAIIEWDADLIIRHWSEASEKIFGWTEPEILGKSIYTLNSVYEVDFSKVKKIVEDLASGVSTQIFSSNRNRTKDGKTIFCEWYNSVLLDETGEVISVMSRVLDVTKRVETELLVSENEEKFRLLHEAAGVGIGYYNTSGEVISFNNIAAQNMNGKPEDFNGKSVFELFAKPEAEIYLDRINKAASSETPHEYEDRVELPETIKWFNSIYTRIIDKNNEVAGIQIVSTDITERKNTEKDLLESKSFFEQLFIQSSTSTQLLDKDGWCVHINPKLSELFGVLPEHIEGRKYNIFHDDEIIRTGVIKHIKRVFEHLETVKWEVNFDIQHASKSTGVEVSNPIKKWFQNTSYPILDASGKLIYVIIQHDDITNRKNAELELRNAEAENREILIKSEKRYRTLFENINAGFVLFEVVQNSKGVPVDLIIVAANNLFEKTTGLKNEEVTGKRLTKVLPGIENDAADWISTYGNIALNGEAKQFEQGSELLGYYYSVVAFQAEKNQCAVTFIDITENKRVQKELIDLNRDLEKRVEERTKELLNSQAALLNLVEDIHEKSSQLQKNKEKLEAKNKELETFTYSVSHDLKAPLRGIDGYSRLLEELYSDKLTGEGPRFIQSIREGTKQMNQLIEDLLAYSRLERSIFRFAKIKIRELIETVLLLLQNEISAKNVNIEILVDDCLIETDYDGLSIVLRNLVENAIKFSATQTQAQIKILFKDNVNSWSIIVEDNGIGFDMKYHDRIFEIFQRLNLPEQYAGTGIGLAMVSKSVERMNGKIWAESSPGNGAKFYLEIPKNQKT